MYNFQFINVKYLLLSKIIAKPVQCSLFKHVFSGDRNKI